MEFTGSLLAASSAVSPSFNPTQTSLIQTPGINVLSHPCHQARPLLPIVYLDRRRVSRDDLPTTLIMAEQPLPPQALMDAFRALVFLVDQVRMRRDAENNEARGPRPDHTEADLLKRKKPLTATRTKGWFYRPPAQDHGREIKSPVSRITGIP